MLSRRLTRMTSHGHSEGSGLALVAGILLMAGIIWSFGPVLAGEQPSAWGMIAFIAALICGGIWYRRTTDRASAVRRGPDVENLP